MTETIAINNLAGLISAIADLLRSDYKQSEHSRVILPLVMLRGLDCVRRVAGHACGFETESTEGGDC